MSYYKRRRRRFRSDQLKKLGIVALCIAAVSIIALFLFLKPYSDAAGDLDMENVAKVEEASIIFDRHGTEMGRIYVENRIPVKLDQVPGHLIKALIAAEDSRFFNHGGVDVIGICRAILLNFQARRVTQGASTITQQLGKQTFFRKESRSVGQKLVEAFTARRIESTYSKEEILEHYLNRIFFGHDMYGINAAALGYFGKPVEKLDVLESATICGLIKAPNKYTPLRNPENSKTARNMVLHRMAENNMLTQEESRKLQAMPVETNPQDKLSRSSYVYHYIKQKVVEEIGAERASAGGFRIFTTIDMQIQQKAQEAVRQRLLEVEERPVYEKTVDGKPNTYNEYVKYLEAGGKRMDENLPYLQGSALMVDNASGGIVAMVGGRNFYHSQFNCATSARRPSGTAFKPLVYTAAFSQPGLFPGTLVVDKMMDNMTVGVGGTMGVLGEWGVESPNNRYLGEITARRALVLSKNAASVDFGYKVGVNKVIETATNMGISSPMRKYPSTFLGSSAVTLAEMVKAYTTYPNVGRRPKNLFIIEKIESSRGVPIFTLPFNTVKLEQATDPYAAYQTHSCLEEALRQGTGKKAAAYGLQSFPSIGGKTGTSYGFRDTWFLGYNSQVTCGVWAGYIKKKTIYDGAFSNEIALPIWVDIMNASTEKFQAEYIERPDGPDTPTIEICQVSGLPAGMSCYENYQEEDQPFASTKRVRCTVSEVIRGDQISGRYDFCPVHGAEEFNDEGGIPEPSPAGEYVTNRTPIVLRSSTLIGNDPFNAVLPKFDPKHKISAAVADEPRAEVVNKDFEVEDKLSIFLQPPPPIEIE